MSKNRNANNARGETKVVSPVDESPFVPTVEVTADAGVVGLINQTDVAESELPQGNATFDAGFSELSDLDGIDFSTIPPMEMMGELSLNQDTPTEGIFVSPPADAIQVESLTVVEVSGLVVEEEPLVVAETLVVEEEPLVVVEESPAIFDAPDGHGTMPAIEVESTAEESTSAYARQLLASIKRVHKDAPINQANIVAEHTNIYRTLMNVLLLEDEAEFKKHYRELADVIRSNQDTYFTPMVAYRFFDQNFSLSKAEREEYQSVLRALIVIATKPTAAIGISFEEMRKLLQNRNAEHIIARLSRLTASFN